MNRAEHWEQIYKTKDEAELSWTQAEPSASLALIAKACATGRVIDVGGGSSVLCERLLERGYEVAVLDISEAALERARKRTGSRATEIAWICADVTSVDRVGSFDLWHDRAVFHFLTAAEDRAAYKKLLRQSIAVGGHALIGCFALDGPEKCSGLEVRRYDAATLAAELGAEFELIQSERQMHATPWGAQQSFQFCLFKRRHAD